MRAGRGLFAVVGIALLLVTAAGCQPKRGKNVEPYTGPLLTVSELLTNVNGRANPSATLWAQHDFVANITDAKGKRREANGTGVLLYIAQTRSASASIRLTGKGIVGNLFDAGSDGERFWLLTFGDEPELLWGEVANAGLPCAAQLPVRVDHLEQVLGLSNLPGIAPSESQPLLVYDELSDQYRLTYADAVEGRTFARSEMFFDRATLQLRRARFYDTSGRLSTEATVTPPRSRATSSPSMGLAPRYDFKFAQSKSDLTLYILESMPQRRGVPRAGSIRFPDEQDASSVIRIDEDCP